jgi:DNA-binding MarR family transcriptional regulator
VPRQEPAPTTELPFLLATEIRAAFRKIKLRLREHGGPGNLTPAQLSVLLRLENEGAAAVSNLARAEGMRPQSMSSVVAPLEQAGLVRGAPDPSDRRQTLISLTPKFLKQIQKGREARQDWLTTAIARKLSPQQQKKLQAALALLTRLVDD